MRAVLVANPKGGAGKTTLAVNLAGLLAARGERVALLDLDRQKSATAWLAMRDPDLPRIAALADGRGAEDGWLVIDSPAGLHGKNLERALKLAHRVLVPVPPSLFDIRASQDFLDALMREKAVRRGHAFVGVVAMRVDARTRAGATLEHYAARHALPVIAWLHDAQCYVNAAFEGKSLADLPPHRVERELEAWQGVIDWVSA
jgi:chromosome partitioning protein